MSDNELIAEFMGAKYQKRSFFPLTSWRGDWFFIFTESDGREWIRQKEELEYDTSWDWLMPVVEKCEQINDEKQKQFPEYKSLDDPTGWRAWSYRHITLSTNINRVHEDVVEFIKFYNANHHSHEQQQ